MARVVVMGLVAGYTIHHQGPDTQSPPHVAARGGRLLSRQDGPQSKMASLATGPKSVAARLSTVENSGAPDVTPPTYGSVPAPASAPALEDAGVVDQDVGQSPADEDKRGGGAEGPCQVGH